MSSDTLAVIPARGGSKRVPRKNIREVAGKPLVGHAIDQAKAANEIDRAIVSTDSDEIAKIARDCGGDVPFMRPDHLATDHASTGPVVTHALDWATEEYGDFEYVCLLQVTSPLRKPNDIDNALDRLKETDAKSVVSVSEYLSPLQWAVVEDEQEHLDSYFESAGLWSDEYVRSQDFDDLYHPNGAVAAATITAWDSFKSFYTPQTVGYKMPPERSFDIDEPWELELVRKFIEN